MGIAAGMTIAVILLLAGGAAGWVLGSIYLTIRAIEDQEDIWDDDDDL